MQTYRKHNVLAEMTGTFSGSVAKFGRGREEASLIAIQAARLA